MLPVKVKVLSFQGNEIVTFGELTFRLFSSQRSQTNVEPEMFLKASLPILLLSYSVSLTMHCIYNQTRTLMYIIWQLKQALFTIFSHWYIRDCQIKPGTLLFSLIIGSAESPGIIVQNSSPDGQRNHWEKNSRTEGSKFIFPAVKCFRMYRRKALTKSNGSKRGPERN